MDLERDDLSQEERIRRLEVQVKQLQDVVRLKSVREAQLEKEIKGELSEKRKKQVRKMEEKLFENKEDYESILD